MQYTITVLRIKALEATEILSASETLEGNYDDSPIHTPDRPVSSAQVAMRLEADRYCNEC